MTTLNMLDLARIADVAAMLSEHLPMTAKDVDDGEVALVSVVIDLRLTKATTSWPIRVAAGGHCTADIENPLIEIGNPESTVVGPYEGHPTWDDLIAKGIKVTDLRDVPDGPQPSYAEQEEDVKAAEQGIVDADSATWDEPMPLNAKPGDEWVTKRGTYVMRFGGLWWDKDVKTDTPADVPPGTYAVSLDEAMAVTCPGCDRPPKVKCRLRDPSDGPVHPSRLIAALRARMLVDEPEDYAPPTTQLMPKQVPPDLIAIMDACDEDD